MFQCAVNLSEGRNPELLERVRIEMEKLPGVILANLSMDPDHHRMVVSLLGKESGLTLAILRLFELASEFIDLRIHQGVHPRIGAVDVIPFVPLGGTPMGRARDLALETARQIAKNFQVPLILYEESAQRPENRALPDLRRGGLEGLAQRLQQIPPDFGPPQPHVQLGATILGARRPLVAFNLMLNTDNLEIARDIARSLRASNGGLPSVRALGLRLESTQRMQISINLTDPEQVDLWQVYDAAEKLCAQQGVEIVSSELIGLAPARSFLQLAQHHLRMPDLEPGQLLEWNFLHQAWRLEDIDETR